MTESKKKVTQTTGLKSLSCLLALILSGSLNAQTPAPTTVPTAAATVSATPSVVPTQIPTDQPQDFVQQLRGVPFADQRHTDKKQRDPLLTVGSDIFNGVGRVLVDVTNLNNEFRSYPLRLEFFINRKLTETQYYSVTQPGPLGVSVPVSIAKPPFDYSVVATVIHPNRSFSTAIEGRVFATNLRSTLNCKLTVPSELTNSIDRILEQEVETRQASNDTITVAIESSDNLQANADLNLLDSVASGNLSLNLDQQQSSGAVTGEYQLDTNNSVSSLSVQREDGVSLECLK